MESTAQDCILRGERFSKVGANCIIVFVAERKNLQRTRACADKQTIPVVEDFARCALVLRMIVDYPALPDCEFLALPEGARSRIGLRLRPNKVIYLLAAFRPVDQSVFRRALGKDTPFAFVLYGKLGASCGEARKMFRYQLHTKVFDAFVE